MISDLDLGQIITHLKSLPQDQATRITLHSPHSYRGIYEDLAVEPDDSPSTVGEMLSVFDEACGNTYQGYKGGDFKMERYTTVWLDYRGAGNGERLGQLLLEFITGER